MIRLTWSARRWRRRRRRTFAGCGSGDDSIAEELHEVLADRGEAAAVRGLEVRFEPFAFAGTGRVGGVGAEAVRHDAGEVRGEMSISI